VEFCKVGKPATSFDLTVQSFSDVVSKSEAIMVEVTENCPLLRLLEEFKGD